MAYDIKPWLDSINEETEHETDFKYTICPFMRYQDGIYRNWRPTLAQLLKLPIAAYTDDQLSD